MTRSFAWMVSPLVVACGFGSAGGSGPSRGGSDGELPVGGQGGVSAGAGAATVHEGGRVSTGGAGAAGAPRAGVAGDGGSRAGSGGGGSGAAGGGGSGGAPVTDDMQLVWRDDFDAFDDTRWSKADHTFAENLARFAPDNVVVSGGMLRLRVTNEQNGNKPYTAAEVYSNEQFTFGRFEARVKFCAGSGMVSSLFTYRDEVTTSWQEIDIEHLGYLPMAIQYNLIWGNLSQRQYQPHVTHLQYSPAAEFHDYSIEWSPDVIVFYIDGVETHRDVQATIRDAARLRMNAWPANYQVTTFAGPLDPAAIPCEAQYDWVQVFAYQP